MIKIGIVSRIHGINYGANLQAYALQSVLTKLGYEPSYINYNVKITTRGLRKLLSFGYAVIRSFLGYSKRLRRTNEFRRKIKLSKALESISNIKVQCEKYDILLSGSDQIWNPRYYASSYGLYLFELNDNTPKASYASSFGVTEIQGAYKSTVNKCLSKYKLLSCRENSGVNILNGIGLNADRHIDPTLLLTKEEWLTEIQPTPIINKKYICCYVMPGVSKLNSTIIEYAEAIKAKRTDIDEIVIIGDKEYVGLTSKHIYVRDAGPLEFMNLIHNASFVLTSSFHGTCFSIIFQKQFFSILESSNKFNSRIMDLLALLGIEERLIMSDDVDRLKSTTSFENIDYDKVNEKLNHEREVSFAYLSSLKKISDK